MVRCFPRNIQIGDTRNGSIAAFLYQDFVTEVLEQIPGLSKPGDIVAFYGLALALEASISYSFLKVSEYSP